ncbi:MAG TPA: acyl carrier protein [Lachnospiraceae bacterium]|nr:phosphopantetheine-binding protein [uncultured Lachnoclostridium sp.]HAU84585.1 acyl carrier protein [Lachnospiraceae bacterium]
MENKVLGVIKNNLEDENMLVITESRFSEDLGLNSYQFISLISDLEDELGIEMEENEILKIRTVGQLIEYVQNCCTE